MPWFSPSCSLTGTPPAPRRPPQAFRLSLDFDVGGADQVAPLLGGALGETKLTRAAERVRARCRPTSADTRRSHANPRGNPTPRTAPWRLPRWRLRLSRGRSGRLRPAARAADGGR